MEYAGFGIAPEVNRLALHFTNVTVNYLWNNADVWVDPFTNFLLYVAPSPDQDLGFFVFNQFQSHLDPYTKNELFNLPSVILDLCHQK